MDESGAGGQPAEPQTTAPKPAGWFAGMEDVSDLPDQQQMSGHTPMHTDSTPSTQTEQSANGRCGFAKRWQIVSRRLLASPRVFTALLSVVGRVVGVWV